MRAKVQLGYAYIDISKIWNNNQYYWQVSWNDERPNWVPQSVTPNSSDYHIKYWRKQWIDILKNILPSVTSKGYDGIVFGGAERFSNFPLPK